MDPDKSGVLDLFHPAVRGWFAKQFPAPTEAQLHGWPAIASGSSTLIAAPTGSGKTLAAFLCSLNHLVRRAGERGLPDAVQILYISPLKALNTDIHLNLQVPLAGIQEEAARLGLDLPEIRSAVRTGDTPASDRARAAKRPPHILITTPESFFILLTTERFRRALSTVRYVIVDEIHALAGNKRGVHLSLSLERLDRLTPTPPLRIGLSATQNPIEEISRFLVGYDLAGDDAEPRPRPCRIVNVGWRRPLDLALHVPPSLGAVATTAVWEATYDRLADLIRAHRTTLIFANSRRLVERIALRLTERLGENAVAAHHGSLSRQERVSAEKRLKAGEIAAIVATGSLELGIDIGTIDLVCQIQSPRSVATALQRVGRSGHGLGATSKGRLFPLTRDDLIECTALLGAIREGHLDRLEIPSGCLDVLAQQIVAVAADEEWNVDDLYRLVRRSFCYRDLPRADLSRLLTMLSERLPTEPRGVFPHLYWDRISGRIRGRRGARLTALTGGGTIPDTTNYDVYADPPGVKIGDVEEDFAQESMVGDIFTLGNAAWRIRRVERGRMTVESAAGLPPTIPFWHGEAPGRTYDLSLAVSRLRSQIAARLEKREEAIGWITSTTGVDEKAAACAVDYVAEQQAALGLVPSDALLVAERFFDNLGGTQVVLHSPFGMRINRAWGLALSKRICRGFNFEIQSAATDNAVLLSFGPRHSFPLEALFHFLGAESVEETLIQALLASPLFETRFRHAAVRSLVIPRHAGSRRVPAYLQRLRATDLLAACFPAQAACQDNQTGDIPVSDYPIVTETIRECLHEALDIRRLKSLLEKLHERTIRAVATETAAPSPFAEEILAAWDYSYIDDAPREERRSRTVTVPRSLLADLLPRDSSESLLDPAAVTAIETEVSRTSPDRQARGEDELVELLKEMGPLPLQEITLRVTGDPLHLLEQLREKGRVTRAARGPGDSVWIATEILPLCQAAYLSLALADPVTIPPEIAEKRWEAEAARAELIRRLLRHAGPISPREIARRLALPVSEISQALAALEGEGVLFQGRFLSSGEGESVQWCERTILERIHRLTLTRLRKEITPVPPEVFADFLLHWQHVAAGTRLHGLAGAEEILTQLQGIPLPPSLWEQAVLPARLADYTPALLDHLCLSGSLLWSATGGPDRLSTLTFFLRDAPASLRSSPGDSTGDSRLSPEARAVHTYLASRGASFAGEIAAAAKLETAPLFRALWELTRSGLVTADSIAPVRFFLEGGRPRHLETPREKRPSRHTLRLRVKARALPGRWSLLPTEETAGEERCETWARQILDRYGVVFREILDLETGAPSWRDLAEIYRRLEWKGEARRGLFVSGVSGEQYALPGALDLLRARRSAGRSGERVLLSACDPATLVGSIIPSPALTRLPGNVVILQDGRPLLALNGTTLQTSPALAGEEITAALTLLLETRGQRLRIESCNDTPILASPVATLLRERGGYPEDGALLFDSLPDLSPHSLSLAREQ